MENNFKVSQLAERVKEILLNHTYEFDEEDVKIFKTDEEKIKKAVTIICDSWNRNEKSRNFIKHLIASFFRVQPFNKVYKFDDETIKNKQNRCAILGCFLAGIKDIANVGGRFMIEHLKLQVETDEQKRKELIDYLKSEMSKYPKAIQEHRYGYYSENSNKFISPEALIALRNFASEMVLSNDDEIRFTLNKIRIKEANSIIKKQNRLNKKQVNEVARANTYSVSDGLSKETLDKLRKIKQELEN